MPRQRAASVPTLLQTTPMDVQSVRTWSNWRHALNRAPPFLSQLIQPFLPNSFLGWRRTDGPPSSPENPYSIVKPNAFISTLHQYITTLSCSHIYPRIVEIASQTPSLLHASSSVEGQLMRTRRIEQNPCVQRRLNDARERIASGNCSPVICHYRALIDEYIRVTLEVANEDPEYKLLDQAVITCTKRDHRFKCCGQSDCLPQPLLPPPPLPLALLDNFKMSQVASFGPHKRTLAGLATIEFPDTTPVASHNRVRSFPGWFSKIRHSPALSKLPRRILPRRRVRGASEPPMLPSSSPSSAYRPGPTTHSSPDSQSPETPLSSRGLETNTSTSPNVTMKGGALSTPQCGCPAAEFPGQRSVAKNSQTASAPSSPFPNLTPIASPGYPSAKHSSFIPSYSTPPRHDEVLLVTAREVDMEVQNGENSAPPPLTFTDLTKKAVLGGKVTANKLNCDHVSSSFPCHPHDQQCVISQPKIHAANDFAPATSDQGGHGDDELSDSSSSPSPGSIPPLPTNRKRKFDARRDLQVNATVNTIVWIQQCTDDMERFGPSYFEDPNQSPVSGRRVAIKFRGEPVATTHLASPGPGPLPLGHPAQLARRYAPYPAGPSLLNRRRKTGLTRPRGQNQLKRRNALNPWDPEPEHLQFLQLALEHEERCDKMRVKQAQCVTREAPVPDADPPANAKRIEAVGAESRCAPSNPNPTTREDSVTEVASHIGDVQTSPPPDFPTAIEVTPTHDNSGPAAFMVRRRTPANFVCPFDSLRDSSAPSRALFATHCRPTRRLRARCSTLTVAADAVDNSISTRTQSHTRVHIHQQTAESRFTRNSSARDSRRLARQDAMSPVRPLAHSARVSPRTGNSPAAATSSTAPPAPVMSPLSRVARSANHQQEEAVVVAVPRTACVPSTLAQHSPRKRARDDDYGSNQAHDWKKKRIF